MIIHKTLTAERWAKFSIFEQMANIGCEIERTIHWRNAGNEDYSIKSFYRALELLDFSINDVKNAKGKRRELVRVRELTVDFFLFDNEYETSIDMWQSYFYAFNYAAAIQRGR